MSRTGKADISRTAFHLFSPFFLLYYILPSDSYIGLNREYLVIAILIVIFVFELTRIAMKIKIPGLRDYEMSRPAAYAMGGLAIGIGLLVFHMPLTIVAVCGMAWIDPLCRITRRAKYYPALPLVSYFVLAIIVFISTEYSLTVIIMLAAVGSIVAIASEYPNLKVIDDDFVMIIVPLVVMGGLELLFSSFLP